MGETRFMRLYEIAFSNNLFVLSEVKTDVA